MSKNIKSKENKVIVYQAKSGAIELKGDFSHETIWATQSQIVDLFKVDQSVVSRHIKNVFKDGEIQQKSNMQKMHNANSDKLVAFYSLDVILSVGYRTNSKVAIDFRKWATKTLRSYISKGYVINEKRLLEAREKFKELQTAVNFLEQKSKKEILSGQEGEILSLLASYAKTLTILDEYDKGEIKEIKGSKSKFILSYENCLKIIDELKKELKRKGEAGDLFGNEKDRSFEGIIKGLYQTFGGKELYPNIEDKASHILYLIIKDHPFSDGNKRSGAFLFVYFLDKSNHLNKENGERKINDNTLTALALLVAESDPKEKEIIIKIIKNLIT